MIRSNRSFKLPNPTWALRGVTFQEKSNFLQSCWSRWASIETKTWRNPLRFLTIAASIPISDVFLLFIHSCVFFSSSDVCIWTWNKSSTHQDLQITSNNISTVDQRVSLKSRKKGFISIYMRTSPHNLADMFIHHFVVFLFSLCSAARYSCRTGKRRGFCLYGNEWLAPWEWLRGWAVWCSVLRGLTGNHWREFLHSE